ncbi:hypothetical protein SSX86_031579 [Deinandra increscens subsp. villosa]|uniref:RRM domain-containing protein n=1 Tax=Deinandra increscens subsp. villosa TaxID=3103831 RepID=A0AAP0GI30_9ASTR
MAARDRYKVDQWYNAPSKRGRDNRNSHRSSESNGGVKFFVSNLPQGCSSADLSRVLKGYGDVKGTYIARKLDRLGKRFGFVTFNTGRNMNDLADDLKDAWIGSYKLYIVPAMFVDGKEIPRNVVKTWQPVKEKEIQQEDKAKDRVDEPVAMDVNVENRRTFKDTLLNKEAPVRDVVEINVDQSIVAFGDWFDRAVIIHLKSLEALTTLRVWLKNLGVVEVEIKYVGGLCAMLVFDNSDMKKAFTSRKEEWGGYVVLLEEWYGQTFQVPRIAWIKIRGVPLSIACSKVFDEVAAKFGSVVQPAIFPEEDGDLSVACVGISRSDVVRVNQKVVLNWKASKFEVWVEEEGADWIPDCLMSFEDDVTTEEVLTSPEAAFVDEQAFDLNVAQPDNIGNIGVGSEDTVILDNNDGVTKEVGGSAMKKRKGFNRKKGNRKLSVSPVGNDRPKKRQREGEDMFDLDRFIYTVNEGQRTLENEDSSDVIRNSQEEAEGDMSMHVDGCELGGNNVVINKERGETILMAESLGVRNMDKFSNELVQTIVNEGFQCVDQ